MTHRSMSMFSVRAFLLKRPACMATHHEIASALKIEWWRASTILSYMRRTGLVECVRKAARGRMAKKLPGLWQLTITGVHYAPQQRLYSNQHIKRAMGKLTKVACDFIEQTGKQPPSLKGKTP